MKGFKMPGGGDIAGLMKQAQKMQVELQRVQQEALLLTAEGSAGGGGVKAVANGKNQVVSLQINKELVSPDDVEMLQDTVVLAINDALTKVQARTQEELKKVTGGMNLPGM